MAKIIPSDGEIQRNILDELDWDPEVEAPDIGVEVDDGVVTLNGTVANHAIKVAAERAAQRVHGVRAVANDVVVHAAGEGGRTDTDIALAIADRFEWSDVIPEEQLRVTVEDGKVTLGGAVGWRYEATEAEQLVRRIRGVTEVINDIAVVPPQETDEDEVGAEIERAFRRHAELDAQHITVRIVGPTVVLSGAVSSWSEREDAERVAWRSPGIRHVKNELRIEP